MPEQQNIEYKQSWQDGYLKCICGFANARGGMIFIGKDNNGKTVGVADYKKLMDDLPNKIRDVLRSCLKIQFLWFFNHQYFGQFFDSWKPIKTGFLIFKSDLNQTELKT